MSKKTALESTKRQADQADRSAAGSEAFKTASIAGDPGVKKAPLGKVSAPGKEPHAAGRRVENEEQIERIEIVDYSRDETKPKILCTVEWDGQRVRVTPDKCTMFDEGIVPNGIKLFPSDGKRFFDGLLDEYRGTFVWARKVTDTKRRLEEDDTMEPIVYLLGAGEAIWGKSLDSREITIEEYLKRIDPPGRIWKDDGSLPLFDFSQEKIIEHIKKIKTFKKANDYLNKLGIIFNFVLERNGGSIPRCVNFLTIESIVKMNFAKKSRFGSTPFKKHEMDKPYLLTYWQDVLGQDERTLRGWVRDGLGARDAKRYLKADTSAARGIKTTRRNIEIFYEEIGREIPE